MYNYQKIVGQIASRVEKATIDKEAFLEILNENEKLYNQYEVLDEIKFRISEYKRTEKKLPDFKLLLGDIKRITVAEVYNKMLEKGVFINIEKEIYFKKSDVKKEEIVNVIDRISNNLLEFSNKCLAERIKNQRKIKGYSQVALAERVGVTKQTISKIETENMPKVPKSLLNKIAEGLECSIWYLTGESDSAEYGGKGLIQAITFIEDDIEIRLLKAPIKSRKYIEKFLECNEKLTKSNLEALTIIMDLFLTK